MQRQETAIIIAVFTLLFVCAIMIFLFIIFQKRKNALLLEQKENEKWFENEISKTQIEIREETFKNISWELHDNIGQLITLAKIQLQNTAEISDIKQTLDKALKEIRTMSKIINPNVLNTISIVESVRLEIERLNRLNFIDAKLMVIGNEKEIDSKAEIIFFRIFQEFVSNTIKHAKATKLLAVINYKPKELIISIKDDGQGFDINNKTHTGIGLDNIKNRAALVNATTLIQSEKNRGTLLTLTYPYLQ